MQLRILRHLLLASLLLLALSRPVSLAAQPTEMFGQRPNLPLYPGISSAIDHEGKRPGRRTADDFMLPAGGNINAVVFWGKHALPSSGKDRFTATFYADNNGFPGRVLLEGRGRVVSRLHDFPTLIEYRMVLCREFSAQPGVRYWISIFNEGAGAAWWWNNSPAGNDGAVQSHAPSNGAWRRVYGANKVDMSFQLGALPMTIWDKVWCNATLLALSATGALVALIFFWRRLRASEQGALVKRRP